MADRDLTRFLPAIVLLSLVGLIIGLQIPVEDTHAEDVRDENDVVFRNAAGPLRFGENSHVQTTPLDSHDETTPLDSHDETTPLDSHDETTPLDSHDEISPSQKMILDRMDDLEKNQENLQKILKDLIEKLKDKT